MTKNNWAEFYSKQISKEDYDFTQTAHKDYLDAIRSSSKSGIIIDAGVGLGSTIIGISRNKRILGIDNDPHVLKLAQELNIRENGNVIFLEADIFDESMYKFLNIDVICSQGVLEHLSDEQMVSLLKLQKKHAKKLVHSVPSIKWGRQDYGNERLMTPEEWAFILRDLNPSIVTYWDDLMLMISIE